MHVHFHLGIGKRKRERDRDTNGGRTLASHGFPFPVLDPHVKICRRTWGVVTWENLLLSFPLGVPLTFFTSSPCLSLFLISQLCSFPPPHLALSPSSSHYRCHHFSLLRDDEMTLLSLSLNLASFSSRLCAHSFILHCTCVFSSFFFSFIYFACNAPRNLRIS